MSTKTLRKRIALVAVSAMGFGLLSVAPTNAVVTATGTASFKAAGSTTAVTNAAGAFNAASSAAVETLYVRSGTTTNTFVVDFGSLTAADALHVVLGKGTTMPAVAADLVNIDGVSVNSTNATIADATLDVDGSGAIATVAASGVTVTTKTGQTAAADFTFTSGALAAGTYTIWVATDNTDLTATSYKLATVTSYNVGAPVTAAYTVDGRTIVAASISADTTYSLNLLDSAGRRTFLIGDEVVNHAWETVASGVGVISAPAATTAGSAPSTTNGGITFTAYTVSANIDDLDDGGAGTADLTTGVTYKLNSVIQSGVNAFGSDSVTVRHLTSTNGLAGTLTFRNVTTLATVSSISLATGDAISAGYQLVLRDSTGAVVEGVRPTVSSSSSATTAQGGTTSSSGLTATGDWTYTAPAVTSDTVTFTVTAGTSASITTSVAISIGASYATADYDGAIAVTANGGRVASGTQSNTSRADLSGGDAVYDHLILNPANTTTVTVTYTLLNNAAPKLPVSGATLSFAVGAPTSSVGGGATTLPTAARVLSATSVATGADGKAAVTVTITGARTNEEFGVVISSGGAQIGYADFLFTDAAVAIGSVSAGPAATITQGAGTATTVTLTALDQYSQAAAGTRIQLLVTGPSAPSSNPIVTTGADGTATYSVSGTTAVAGQTDTVTITNLNGGGSVTAGADDVVTINYLATAPVAGSIRQDFDLAQGTSWTNNAVTAIADAIKALNASGAAGIANIAGPELIGTSSLPIDTLGDWTDSATSSGAAAASYDETVALRFTVLTAAGTAIAGTPVVLSASTGAWIAGSLGTAVSSRTRFTDANGQVSFTVFATKTGTATYTVTSGAATNSIAWSYANTEEDARVITVSSATASVTSGKLVPITATVSDRYGNPVPGVTVTWSESGDGRFEGTPTTTNASGVSTADFAAATGETGSATVRASLGLAAYEQADDFAGYVDIDGATGQATSTYTTATRGLISAPAGIATTSVAVTLVASTEKSAELLAIEAIAAKAAADKAESDAKIKLLEEKIAAVQAAAVAASEAAADAAAEAIDAGNNAFDAATSAGEAADAATAAAEQAGEDATAAATAAGEAAVAAAEAAQEAAAEATDAANAATDAANASAEAADAATAAAQDAADAVAALSTQVSEMISALKKQITALTNLVIKIQKKVRA